MQRRVRHTAFATEHHVADALQVAKVEKLKLTHRESGVLQEAGFRKLGLALCSRLPAFFRAEPQHPRLRIWKQEAGSRTHLKL